MISVIFIISRLRPDHWSKVVGVKFFETLTFLCPNIEISNIPLGSTSRRIYYNLYVREVYPNETSLDYDTICDPKRELQCVMCCAMPSLNWGVYIHIFVFCPTNFF